MTRLLRLCAVLAVGTPAAALPPIPATGVRAEDFAPPGWTIETRAAGDLNGDGAADVALVLLGPDGPSEPPRGEAWLETGARRIFAIAFARPVGGYALAVRSAALLPRKRPPNGASQGWMLFEEGSVGVARRRLRVRFEYTRGHTTFTFRHEGGALRLIGYDSAGVEGGCLHSLSINFLTRRARLLAGWVDREEQAVRWRRLPARPPVTLEEIGEGEAFDPHGLLTGFPLSCPERE
jgi:hypothetical protein